MIGGGISIFGFDLFGPLRKVVEDAREEARRSSASYQEKAAEDRRQGVVERDDNVAFYWSLHFGY
ncbi:hypothetical protein JZX87_28305 [Agrobacterium sp. Ap1]|jgi:hypothetical protein|uniref:hypothetical protein n=1 Tax=Rhizobium/Agrobacterium group TaxID=227290 RepID=UPI001A90B451|nr:hypothetical protein [Agrobacterium sp. Ap1]MBO0145041.1 hypothetical protein [Agrobacterium sp. Ap1]